MLRLALALTLFAGCAPDVCKSFSGHTCIAVELRGPSSVRIDQLQISAQGAFTLTNAPSPSLPRAQAVSLPIDFAVLPGDVIGAFTLTVVGLDGATNMGAGTGSGTLTPNRESHLTVQLVAANQPDMAPTPDLATRPRDLAGLDLAGVQCNPTTQQPCPSGQKCIFVGSPVCNADGTNQVAQSCDTDPEDTCARGSQCLFPGDLTPGNGLCEQFCASDADCRQPAVSVGGTTLANNLPHCLFNVSGAGSPQICSVACNPVATRGASACPGGAVCVYGSNGSFPEFTFCDRAGSGTDGQACDANFRCALGFNCVAVGTTTRCRALCRANTDGDCSGANLCKPGAGGNPPMFGYCCPSSGC
jgi:hypothetical protein